MICFVYATCLDYYITRHNKTSKDQWNKFQIAYTLRLQGNSTTKLQDERKLAFVYKLSGVCKSIVTY
jgi:hypothetical protein